MSEFRQHIDYYSSYWFSSFSKRVPEHEWGDKESAERYLEKYWLPRAEYEGRWKPIEQRIFMNLEIGFPEMLFREGFQLIALRGGCLFIEEEFKRLQKCFLAVGDVEFSVIENTFENDVREPPFRMRYPADITWGELISGNFVSSVIIEMPHREYCVFGNTGGWGEYAATDFENPVEIIGFEQLHETVFMREWIQPAQRDPEIYEWLPQCYKERVRNHPSCAP